MVNHCAKYFIGLLHLILRLNSFDVGIIVIFVSQLPKVTY